MGDRDKCPCMRKDTDQADEPVLYWCEVCEQMFDSKRCPLCGMKLKKVR